MKIDNIQNILDQAKQLDHEIEIISNIKSGKEAVVYKVLLDNKLVAMKLYKNPEERSFKNAGQYLEGKHYQKASEKKAIEKGNKFSKKLKHDNWIRREFFMLEKLYDLGAKIPQPILQIDNAIFMELLGNEDDIAPRLCDIKLTSSEAKKAFQSIIKSILIFWNFGIVHADLSEYNILWWNNKPYIIDFPQSVNKQSNPDSLRLLERDLKNITKFFGKIIEVDYEKIRKQFE